MPRMISRGDGITIHHPSNGPLAAFAVVWSGLVLKWYWSLSVCLCLCARLLGWRHPGFQFPRGHAGCLYTQPGSGQRVQETWHRYCSPTHSWCSHTNTNTQTHANPSGQCMIRWLYQTATSQCIWPISFSLIFFCWNVFKFNLFSSVV